MSSPAASRRGRPPRRSASARRSACPACGRRLVGVQPATGRRAASRSACSPSSPRPPRTSYSSSRDLLRQGVGDTGNQRRRRPTEATPGPGVAIFLAVPRGLCRSAPRSGPPGHRCRGSSACRCRTGGTASRRRRGSRRSARAAGGERVAAGAGHLGLHVLGVDVGLQGFSSMSGRHRVAHWA